MDDSLRLTEPRSIDVAEIAEQRARGWPDFHPEDYCHRCGRRNPAWYTPPDVWQAVYGGDGQPGHYDIVCLLCFLDDAAAAGVRPPPHQPGWRLAPDAPTCTGCWS